MGQAPTTAASEGSSFLLSSSQSRRATSGTYPPGTESEASENGPAHGVSVTHAVPHGGSWSPSSKAKTPSPPPQASPRHARPHLSAPAAPPLSVPLPRPPAPGSEVGREAPVAALSGFAPRVSTVPAMATPRDERAGSLRSPSQQGGMSAVDPDALRVLRSELNMRVGELDCVASGFVSVESYRSIATTLANLTQVLITSKPLDGQHSVTGVPTSPTRSLHATPAPPLPRAHGSQSSHVLGQREQASVLLELLSPRSTSGVYSPRASRQGGFSTANETGATPDWLRLHKTAMAFRLADHMPNSLPDSSASPSPAASVLLSPKQELPVLHSRTSSTQGHAIGESRTSDDGMATRLTVDDLHAITEKDEVLHYFFRTVRKEMPQLAKKLRVMAPSSVLEFSLLESAFKVDTSVRAAEPNHVTELQGVRKVAAKTSFFSNTYLERMVAAFPLSLSSMFSGGYLTPLEPVVAPYASCGSTQREGTEFFVSMQDRANMLQQHGINAYSSAELLLLHIALLSNYASNILSSFSLFMMLACAKRLGDMRLLDAQQSPSDVSREEPVDSDGIPLTVEGMEKFVERCCAIYEETCSEGLDQVRRQYPNVFILSAINATARDKAPVVTIAVSTIVKLIYLFAGGISSISADDRRGTAVLLEELTGGPAVADGLASRSTAWGSASAASALRTSVADTPFGNASVLSTSTFASTGEPRGPASTRSATDATDDVALAAALRIAALSRLGMLSRLMGLDVAGEDGGASVATARACAASWRVMFQFCGVLPYESCPTDMREWIHLFPLYALDARSKRALLHVHAMLSEQREVRLAPVMRERVLLSASILLQRATEEAQQQKEDKASKAEDESGEASPKGEESCKSHTGTSTVVRPTFASHNRGLEQGHSASACHEFYELCAAESVAEHLPPIDLLPYIEEPRRATASELAELPELAAYTHHLVVAFRWTAQPVSRIHAGDDVTVQIMPRKAPLTDMNSASHLSGVGGSSAEEHPQDESCEAQPLVNLVAPNDNGLPLSAPLAVAVQERQRRRSLFATDAPDETPHAPVPPPPSKTSSSVEPVREKKARTTSARMRSARSAPAKETAPAAVAVPELRLTVLAAVDRHISSSSSTMRPKPADFASPNSLPMFIHADEDAPFCAVSTSTQGVSQDAEDGVGPSSHHIQYVVLNASAGSEGWSLTSHRFCTLTHHRRTRPPFRVVEDTAYAWTNPQYDMEADAHRNANVPYTIGWLMGNTLANDVVFQAPLAPLAFRLLARSIKYRVPIEQLVLRPADLSLLGERWTAHVLEASLGQSQENLLEIFDLRAWQGEAEMDRAAASGTATSVSGMSVGGAAGMTLSRRATALRRVIRAIANELCWNVRSDALVSRLFWAEVLRGLQSTSLTSTPLLVQCCARTVRTVLCGRMDSFGSDFSFREQFLLFFDMSQYNTSYHGALSKETVRCMDEDLTPREKRSLLRFIIGRSLLPTLPKTEFLQIVFTDADPLVTPRACDVAARRLPSSFTCDNVLVIPNYFRCLLLGTASPFVTRRVHPDVRADYTIVEEDFSTAWTLLSAQEREALCEDYRAMLGQRLRTAIYESGACDDVADPCCEASVAEVPAAQRPHGGFRRSMTGNVSLTAGVRRADYLAPAGSPVVSAAPSPFVDPTVVQPLPQHASTPATERDMGNLIDLLSGTLFDDVSEAQENAANERKLVTKARATTRAPEAAGDYYRLLVAHAKKLKAEEEELIQMSCTSEQLQSTSTSNSLRSAKKTVQQGAVLYNEEGSANESTDSDWVPRRFLASAPDDAASPAALKSPGFADAFERAKGRGDAARAELVSPKRKAMMHLPVPKPVDHTHGGRTHTAASFTLSPSVSASLSAEPGSAAAAASEKRLSLPNTDTRGSTSHEPLQQAQWSAQNESPASNGAATKRSSVAAPALDDNHDGAAFIAQTEALVGRGSGSSAEVLACGHALPESSPINATHRTPTEVDLDGQPAACATDVARPLVSQHPPGTPAATAASMPPVRKAMPSALRDLASRFDKLQSQMQQQQHRDHGNDERVSAAVEPRLQNVAVPPAFSDSRRFSPGAALDSTPPPSATRHRLSIDKAIDELFPSSIDF